MNHFDELQAVNMHAFPNLQKSMRLWIIIHRFVYLDQNLKSLLNLGGTLSFEASSHNGQFF